MKALFFTALRGLKITENLGGGEKFGETLKITNDKAKIESLLNRSIKEQIGILETNELLSGTPVFFSNSDIPDDMSSQQFLAFKVYEIQLFQLGCWLYKDNAINTEMSYVVSECNGSNKIDSNFIGLKYLNSTGKAEDLHITREELKDIRHFCNSAFGQKIDLTNTKTKLSQDSQRLPRALYFIGAARAQGDLSLKITNYCTAFETLFSTSQAELAHQLSERISFFLASNSEERTDIYRKIKEAYGLRSKVVHGNTIPNSTVNKLDEVTFRCDHYARELIKLVMANQTCVELFKLNQKEFEEELVRLVLSGTHLQD